MSSCFMSRTFWHLFTLPRGKVQVSEMIYEVLPTMGSSPEPGILFQLIFLLTHFPAVPAFPQTFQAASHGMACSFAVCFICNILLTYLQACFITSSRSSPEEPFLSEGFPGHKGEPLPCFTLFTYLSPSNMA